MVYYACFRSPLSTELVARLVPKTLRSWPTPKPRGGQSTDGATQVSLGGFFFFLTRWKNSLICEGYCHVTTQTHVNIFSGIQPADRDLISSKIETMFWQSEAKMEIRYGWYRCLQDLCGCFWELLSAQALVPEQFHAVNKVGPAGTAFHTLCWCLWFVSPWF